MKTEELLLTLGIIIFALTLANNTLFLAKKNYSSGLKSIETTSKNDVEKKISYARFFIFSIVFIVLVIVFFFCVIPLVIKDLKKEIKEVEKKKKIILSSRKQTILERDIALLAECICSENHGRFEQPDKSFITYTIKNSCKNIIKNKKNNEVVYKEFMKFVYDFFSFLTINYRSGIFKKVVIISKEKLSALKKVKDKETFYCELEKLLSFFGNTGISFDVFNSDEKINEILEDIKEKNDYFHYLTNDEHAELKKQKKIFKGFEEECQKKIKNVIFDIINLLIKILCNFVSCPVLLIGIGKGSFPLILSEDRKNNFKNLVIDAKEFDSNAQKLFKALKSSSYYDFSFSQFPEEVDDKKN